MIKEWRSAARVPEARRLAREIGISELIGEALWHRGQRTAAAMRSFLHPEEEPFFDPFLMKDMEAAVGRIESAIERKEKIVVFGDYDVDGMTSTSLLIHNLRALGAVCDYYIPDRKSEGYGLNEAAIEKIAAEGAKLLVSVDCGISSVELVAKMREKIDIVITDHHLPGERLPEALAVVNPHRADCPYPDKNLAGVGVAFKLSQALWKKLRGVDFAGDLELLALGTVADIVPLVGENRKFVKMGLAKMQSPDFLGLRALIEASGLKGREITAGHIGFMLAPRLNAAGRIGSGRDGVRLLLSRDEEEAEELARMLDGLNSERQSIEAEILEAADKKLLAGKTAPEDLAAIVVAGEGWNPGVIGIVASRLVEKYYKPTIVISIAEDGTAKGSCRSIEGLHMYETLAACKAELIQFGGHEMAAGLSLKADKIDDFREAFSSACRERLSAEDYTPKLFVEFELQPKDITIKMVEELSLLEPYGAANAKPVFGVRDLNGRDASAIGQQKQHLRFQAGSREHPVFALYWNHSELTGVINTEPIDMVYSPALNDWNGRTSVQCMVEGVSPARESRVFPERETLARIYSYLFRLRQGTELPYTEAELSLSFRRTGGGVSFYTFGKALKIFSELGLITRSPDEKGFEMPTPKGKMDLSASPTFCRRR